MIFRSFSIVAMSAVPVDTREQAEEHWQKTRRNALTRQYVAWILGVTAGILVFIVLLSAICALEIPGVYRDVDGNRWRLTLHGFHIHGWIVSSGVTPPPLPVLGEPSRWNTNGNSISEKFYDEANIRVRGSWIYRQLGGVAFSVRDNALWFANGDKWTRV